MSGNGCGAYTLTWVSGDETVVKARRIHDRAGRAVFGDRLGFIIFLSGLVFFTLNWRVGIFITDSYAVGNTLATVADGHLAIRELQYSLTYGSQPGLYVIDGSVYGRNYAHVFLSLPVLWLLEGLSSVFDLRLVLAAGWGLLFFLLAGQTGRLVERRRAGELVGSLLSLGAFGGNLLVATPLNEMWLPFIALQVTTVVSAAAIGVGLYRILKHIHGRHVGCVVGFAAVFATPIGFWATVPKRHSFTALAVVVLLTTFYFARNTASPRKALIYRSISYATVALFAWLHAPEALILLGALVPVDLLTARSNHPHRLLVLGIVFLIMLVPFIATNYAIAGNPAEPPRTHPGFSEVTNPFDDESSGDSVESQLTNRSSQVSTKESTGNEITGRTPMSGNGTAGETGTVTDTTSAPGSEDSANGSSPISAFLSVLASLGVVAGSTLEGILWAIQKAATLLDRGVTVLLTEPDRLYYTFVRSGRIPEYVQYNINEHEAIELSLLETAPLLGALSGSLVVGIRRIGDGLSLPDVQAAIGRPERQTDLFVVVLAVLFTGIYLDRVPVETQITVRYLLPLVPLGLYGIGRLESVGHIARFAKHSLAISYLCVLFIGGALLLAVHSWLGLALGEAMQFHALLGLASALLLTIWSILIGLGIRFDVRVGAIVLALPAGLTTLFLLFTGFVYFQYADYALPLVRTVAEMIPIKL